MRFLCDAPQAVIRCFGDYDHVCLRGIVPCDRVFVCLCEELHNIRVTTPLFRKIRKKQVVRNIYLELYFSGFELGKFLSYATQCILYT